MKVNKKQKRIITTALTSAMVATAISPVAAAKMTAAQTATMKVNDYYKLSIRTLPDVQNSAKVKKATLAYIDKYLTSKKDASLKASLLKKVSAKSSAINKYYYGTIKPQMTLEAQIEAALKLASEVPITPDHTVEQVEALHAQIMVEINKVADKTKKANYTAEAERLLKAAKDKIAELATPKVTNVMAISEMSVEITGTSLAKLTADNFSIDGNKVTSYNVNAETGVATLTFEHKFESAKEQTLKLTEKVEGAADKVSEFKFTYTLDIKSVAANAATVDKNTANQKLAFKINGLTTDADVEYIKANGYHVEFQATNAVFSGGGSSSSTGELASSLTSGFAYKVVITDKDGKVVAESSLVEVKAVDKSEMVDLIKSFDITNGAVKLTSNTVVLGEQSQINKVVGDKADGTKDADITDFVEYASSNKDVALIDTDGNILPIKPGTTTITMKVGDVSKTFVLTVSSSARVATTTTLTNSSIKLVESGSPASVGVVVKDQYGDAFAGLDLSNGATYDITKVDVNGTPKEIVTVGGITTDAEGKGSLTVTPAVSGTGSVKVTVGGKLIATVNVSISKDTTVATRKLELVDASKDSELDIYKGETDDSTVTFTYNQYNTAGYLLGKEVADIGIETAKKYTVSVETPSGKEVIDASVSSGVITVTAKVDTGTAYLVIKEGSVVRERVTITVKNSTPSISSVVVKQVDKVTTVGSITAESVLSLRADIVGNVDKSVENVTLSTPSKFKVRLDTTNGMLYLDADNDGTYDTGEVKVGTMAITENISGTPSGTTITTAAGDKGTVVYSIKNASGSVVATSVIDIEVPQ